MEQATTQPQSDYAKGQRAVFEQLYGKPKMNRPFITTFTGKHVYFDDLDNLVLDLDDIVYSAAKVCRFNGHTKFFYSNLRHMYMTSCLCQEPELKLACLLHDVHEVVIGDINGPLAKYLSSGWKTEIDYLKHQLDVQIARQFNCPELVDPACKDRIKYYDVQMTLIESRALLVGGEESHPEPELAFSYFKYEGEGRVIHNYKNKLHYLMRSNERFNPVSDVAKDFAFEKAKLNNAV